MTRRQTDAFKKKFLKVFQECGCVSEAAKIAGLATRRAHYRWLENDARYAEAFSEAKEIAIETLEREVRHRGYEGYLEPVFYQGKKVAVVRKYSDVLLMFLLKALRPEKYRENVHINHSEEVNIVERLRAGRERALALAQERQKPN